MHGEPIRPTAQLPEGITASGCIAHLDRPLSNIQFHGRILVFGIKK